MRLISALSRQQERVAAALARGLTYDQVGTELGISPETARRHVVGILNKLPGDFAPDVPAQKRVVMWWLTRAA